MAVLPLSITKCPHAGYCWLQDTIAALRQQLKQAQQQHSMKSDAPSCSDQPLARDSLAAADTSQGITEHASADKDQPTLCAVVPQAQSKTEARAAAAAEVTALRDMEAQLQRLSATVKSYQGEREQLRQALMAGCAERQALQQQVVELTAKLSKPSPQPVGKQEEQARQEAVGRANWGSLS